MPQQPPWESDPVSYLVRARFGSAATVLPLSPLGQPSANSQAAHERVKMAKKYRDELKALSHEDVLQVAREAVISEMHRAKKKAEEEERERFFNRHDAVLDFQHWSRMSYWSPDEGVALSLGKDPRIVNWEKLKHLVQTSVFAKEYAARRDIVLRAKAMSQLWDATIPSIFLAWAGRMQIPMPDALVEAVTALGLQIGDWKSLYDSQKLATDNAEARYQKSHDEHMATLDEYTDYVKNIRDEHGEIITKRDIIIANHEAHNKKLASRIAELEALPPQAAATPDKIEKSLSARERESLLKILIGMAITGYAYKPNAGRTGTAGEIASDLRLAGLSLDEDTIRKYLNEARDLLPVPETEQKI